MGLRIIGAGVGRTGTHTLKVALEQLLGGPCHHMVEVFEHPEQVPVWTDAIGGRPVDFPALLAGYSAVVDWPGASFWPELVEAFPHALVLLSVRDPDAWYKSASDTIFHHLADDENPWMQSMRRLLAARFCDQLDDPVAMKAALERHNQEVRDRVPADRLIEWSPADGWGPICRGLGVPEPAGPLPVTNTTAEFRSRLGLPPVA